MQIKTVDKGVSHLRGVVIDDELACWLTIIDYRMRIGSANVRMGAVADVNTKKKHRMKGYMRALMEDSLRYMKDRGDDVSVVLGIPDFYYKFGYVPFLPDHALTILTRNAEEAGKKSRKYRVRKFQKNDSGKVLRIYNDNNKQKMCSIIRKKDYFSEFPKEFQDIFVVENNNKNIVAYTVSSKKSKDKVKILEIGARTEDVFGTLLAEFAKMAIKQRVGDIELLLPAHHPFAEFCHRYDCRSTTDYHKNSSGMMAIINQDSLFGKLEMEFNSRISRSRFRNYSGSLELRTDTGNTTLKLSNDSVKVHPNQKAESLLDLPKGQLTQLVVGYRTIKDFLNDTGVKASRGVLPLAETLFPKDNPYIWDLSRFESLRMEPEEFRI